jgi:hypothetical protein
LGKPDYDFLAFSSVVRKTQRERNPGTNWIRGWVGFRVDLDTEARGKILCLRPGIETQSSSLQ